MGKVTEGSVLGLDWGLKKVGYATSDGAGLAITPRGHFARKDPPGRWRLGRHDVEQLKALCERFEIARVVVGWPPSNLEADRAEFRSFLARLERDVALPVAEVDEALTSWASREAGFANEDAGAAALLLEDHFAARGRAGFGALSVLAGIVLLGAGAAGFAAWQIVSKPVSPTPLDLVVDVRPGTSILALGAQLRGLGLDAPAWAVKAWSVTLGRDAKLQPGEFKLEGRPSLAETLRRFGGGVAPLSHLVTMKEGHNLYDFEQSFRGAYPEKGSEALWSYVTDAARLREMGVPPRKEGQGRATLEGFLFPETYSYRKYDPPRAVLDEMIRQFRARALPILSSHPTWGQTSEGRYRLLILASMVEKESGNFEEQPLIASVFWNRISKKMRMQSDPTTIYGLLPNFDGNIKRIHLTTPSPYNTYTLPELPAGPICNPGESALRAVMNPAFTDYLYFVSRNDGTHVFSKDYATHDRYVKEYQLRRRASPAPAMGSPAAEAPATPAVAAPPSSALPKPVKPAAKKPSR